MKRQKNEHPPCKCFRFGYVDHLIAKFLKPPNYNNKQQNNVRFNKRGYRASQKYPKDSYDDNDKTIYASMACMSSDDKSSSRHFGDSFQKTN